MQVSIYSKATGEILRTIGYREDITSLDTPETGAIHSEGISDITHYVEANAFVAFPLRPSDHHTFNYATKQWEDPRTLQDIKALRSAYINTERLKANQASFTHLGKAIAADALSRSDIDAINGEVANTGAFPSGWPGAWKCLDNTWLPITTVAEWKDLYSSMVSQGTQNFAHAQALKAQIDAATTAAQVEAITW